MLAAIEHGDADTLCANVRNVFEQALDGEQRERIETIKCDLLAYGAKTSAMTGSGSVVFGLFSPNLFENSENRPYSKQIL